MRYLIIVFALALSSCEFDLGDCVMASGLFSNFELTGTVPDFELSIDDSVIIDMSNYWRGDTGCGKNEYIPEVVFAESKPSKIELRTAGKHLIVKGLEKGQFTILVNAEVEYISDSCYGAYISNPVEFLVSVTNSTSTRFENEIDGEIGNRLIEIQVEPEIFQMGDTVMVRAIAQDSSIITENKNWKYKFTWVLGGNYKVISNRMNDSCEIGIVDYTSNTLKMVLNDSLPLVRGFTHIQISDNTQLRSGIFFEIPSK